MTQKYGIIVMGVSGCGKSTFGKALAEKLTAPFVEGDDFHPDENVKKMASGHALTDEDRWPWLSTLANHADKLWQSHDIWVASCSALKPGYRDCFRSLTHPVMFVHLALNKDQLTQRLNERHNHFMPSSLLESQFKALQFEDREADIFSLASDQPIDSMLGSFEYYQQHTAAEFLV
jgi:gluconokinase